MNITMDGYNWLHDDALKYRLTIEEVGVHVPYRSLNCSGSFNYVAIQILLYSNQRASIRVFFICLLVFFN